MKIIIIGAGPGGYETALLAAKRGVETVLIEAGPVGGTCLNEGCIPTKSFCKNAQFLDELQHSEQYGVSVADFKFDFSKVTERKNAVVEQLKTGVETLLNHKLITLVRGRASFKDDHTVTVIPTASSALSSDHYITPSVHSVTPAVHSVIPAAHSVTPSVHSVTPSAHSVTPSAHSVIPAAHSITPSAHSVIPSEVEESPLEFTADYIIVATGSTSASLPIPGADLPGILTSKEILDIDHVPQKLCVIGGGVIGLEFASIFRSFGSEVTVLEYCKDILPRFDTDLAKRLKQSLSKRGIEINTQAQVTGIELLNSVRETEGQTPKEEYSISFTRKGKEENIIADKVLMAVGRRAATASLNFSDVGIEFTSKGLCVNQFMQTNIPHIYAIGDINGQMMLAHAATFQGIVALDHLMGIENDIDLSVMPAAVFTSPEAAAVGLTEDECKEKGIPVKCCKSFFRANGKAVSMGETDGFCKIVVAAEPKDGEEEAYEPGRILGCHLFGPHSADIVHEVCALINTKATIDQLRSIIHAHPTLSEVLQMAVHS